jgi:hypothetical protein
MIRIRVSAIFVALVLVFATVALAQDAPDVEIFGGYQYFHANSGISFSGFDNFSLNGWDGAVSGYFSGSAGTWVSRLISRESMEIRASTFHQSARSISTRVFTRSCLARRFGLPTSLHCSLSRTRCLAAPTLPARLIFLSSEVRLAIPTRDLHGRRAADWTSKQSR